MIRTLCFLISFLLLWAAPAGAYKQSFNDYATNIRVWTLCLAEADTGICEDGSTGVDLAATTIGYRTFRVDAGQSTASTFTCAVLNGDESLAAAGASDLSAAAFGGVAAVTNAAKTTTITGPVHVLYINCSAINIDGVVTITLTGIK